MSQSIINLTPDCPLELLLVYLLLLINGTFILILLSLRRIIFFR